MSGYFPNGVDRLLGTKTKQLEKIQMVCGAESMASAKKLQEEIDVLMENKDLKWKQRA